MGLGLPGFRLGQFRKTVFRKDTKLGTKVIFTENKKVNHGILKILKC